MKHKNSTLANCWQIAVFVLLAYPAFAQGTFTENYPINCGDTAVIGSLGYPTWNDPHIVQPPKWGFAQLIGDFAPPNILVYQAPPCFTGKDTVVIECAHATQLTCDTGIYVFDISCGESLQNVFTYQVPCGDTTMAGYVNPWFGPQIFDGPLHGKASVVPSPVDVGFVQYIPDPGFEGLDWVKVRYNNVPDTLLFLFQVSCTALATTDPHPIRPLKIFPNPSTNSVLISGPQQTEQVWIVDVLGSMQQVEGTQQGERRLLNLTGLPAGVYRILALGDGHLYSGSVLKQ